MSIMASHDDDKAIDFKKLERELNTAVEADAKYWRENDAKFRAVNQRVGSYDEFRDMVKASHLKPLEKDDRLTEIKFNQPWNSPASKKELDLAKDNGKEVTKGVSVPKNNHDFIRDWRRLKNNTSDQYSFLVEVGSKHIGIIFKQEIGFGLLGDFINCFTVELKAEDIEAVLLILEQLAETNRFSLTVQFLSSKEKATCQNLFSSLQKIVEEQRDDEAEQPLCQRLEALHTLYEIKK